MGQCDPLKVASAAAPVAVVHVVVAAAVHVAVAAAVDVKHMIGQEAEVVGEAGVAAAEAAAEAAVHREATGRSFCPIFDVNVRVRVISEGTPWNTRFQGANFVCAVLMPANVIKAMKSSLFW